MEENAGSREIRISPPDLIVKAAVVVLGMLALFLLVMTFKQFKEFRYIGSGVSASNTISVSGVGEVTAIPDIATFSVTVQEEASEVSDAQDTVTEKSNAIIAYLKEQGIEDRDIKTADYNVYPQYDWVQDAPRSGIMPPGRQVLRGYQVSHALTVKVRDAAKAGALLAGVGSRGATTVSGLSLTIDDEDTYKMEARKKAIAEAKAKADELAKQLGVSVVRVVGFSEDSYYPPMPYAARGAATFDMAIAQEAKLEPDLPVGENKIVSNVNITYEIR